MSKNDWTVAITKTDKPSGAKAQCARCRQVTKHDVLAEIGEHGASEHMGMDYWHLFQIVQCCGCERLGFRACQSNTDNVEYDPGTGMESLVELVSLYPETDRSRPTLDNLHLLPGPTRLAYQETVDACAADLRLLAGIGVRAVVESVCNDKASGANLKTKIDHLVAQGLLANQDAELLHNTRLLGNKSAHEVAPLTEEALDAALGVVEHLLRTVYLNKELASKLK